jgi:hypothetical protein
MPTPFNLQFTADLWTTNIDQKLQLLEQLLVLFNPSMEIQTSNNFVDWTSLSLVELTGMTFSSRSIPQGLEQDIDIASLNFQSPIWLTTPAKVKKLGVITKIITSIYDEASGTIASGEYDPDNGIDHFSGRSAIVVNVTTLGNLGLLILDNTAKLIPEGNDGTKFVNWYSILDKYPGKFRAGLSQLRLNTPTGNQIVAYINLDPVDDSKMILHFDVDTIPQNTLGTINAIINPETFKPVGTPVGVRYLLLENIRAQPGLGPDAWLFNDNVLVASANDIIEWTGTNWIVVFNAAAATGVLYITNTYTGIQYKWENGSWSKSYEGIYSQESWSLVL